MIIEYHDAFYKQLRSWFTGYLISFNEKFKKWFSDTILPSKRNTESNLSDALFPWIKILKVIIQYYTTIKKKFLKWLSNTMMHSTNNSESDLLDNWFPSIRSSKSDYRIHYCLLRETQKAIYQIPDFFKRRKRHKWLTPFNLIFQCFNKKFIKWLSNTILLLRRNS